MHRAHHPHEGADRLYMKRATGERRLITVEDSVRIELEDLMKYLGESKRKSVSDR